MITVTILEDFFYGNILPCEYEQSAEVRKKLSEMNITIDRLIAAAQDENLKAAIEKAFDKQSELIALCERDTYLAGFKLASRLITAILAD